MAGWSVCGAVLGGSAFRELQIALKERFLEIRSTEF